MGHIDDGDDDYESESDIKNDPRLQLVTSTFPFPSILDLIGGNLTLCTQYQYTYSPYCTLYCSYLFPQDADGENLFNSQELRWSDHFPYFFDLIVWFMDDIVRRN